MRGSVLTATTVMVATGCGGGSTAGSTSTTAPKSTTTLSAPTGSTISTTQPGSAPIVVVFMENRNYSSVEGDPCCPFETQLAARARLFTNFDGVTYPSKPNYLAFAGGSTFGQTGNDDPLPLITSESVFHQMSAAGITWKAWAEDYPGTPRQCSLQSTATNYAIRHVAPLLFSDVAHTKLCKNVTATEPTTLPRFLWVTPNMCHDGHDCDAATGDRWLSRHVPPWIADGSGGLHCL